ncbi:ECF transporter S component [Macrococcus sp. DPC7161]|uniref:ECF transporter S component n=1 Tax=Macrococcus sp. DPC7161 TaxID=2507060 RepID=UPI00100BFBC3|nr:ECF transporter S component [Macrococcus sp. DPC7161]RXK19297.1 ECF transporter S component [Macrococcus sp. DPC7161]
MTQLNKTRTLLIISILSAISVVLMFLKFPIPGLPPYLTLDFSDIPALLALFTIGPVGAIGIEIIKNVINFFFNMADPIGPVANALAGISFLLGIYAITKGQLKRLIPGFLLGTFVLTIVMSLLNYFVLLKLYGMIVNLGDISNNLKVIITAGIIPFNLIKGFVLALLFMIVVKPIVPMIKRNTKY